VSDGLDQAAERWLASMQARRRRSLRPPRILSPMDELTYFELPKMSVVNIGGVGSTQIVGNEPRRVVLILSCPAGSPIFVSPRDEGGTQFGLTLSNTTLPLILNQKDHGPLTQVTWFGETTAVGAVVHVVEVLIAHWEGEL
jgi:hypothetical protein